MKGEPVMRSRTPIQPNPFAHPRRSCLVIHPDTGTTCNYEGETMSVGANNKQDALVHLQWIQAQIINIAAELDRVRIWLVEVKELLEKGEGAR